MALSIIFLFLTTFLGCAEFISAKSVRSCHVMKVPLQQNLDLDKFSGKWYGTMKTGMKDSLLSYFTEIYDGRIQFKTNLAGGYDLLAAGSKFYGGWCPKGKGTAVVNDKSTPERMTMYFDTKIGRKIGMKPGWLLKTDYKSYGVFYSCWKELSDGTCDPDSTYAFVIQRSTNPLSREAQKQVDQALKNACVDRKNMSPIKHYGYCSGKDGL